MSKLSEAGMATFAALSLGLASPAMADEGYGTPEEAAAAATDAVAQAEIGVKEMEAGLVSSKAFRDAFDLGGDAFDNAFINGIPTDEKTRAVTVEAKPRVTVSVAFADVAKPQLVTRVAALDAGPIDLTRQSRLFSSRSR